jgi:hypothetical protein
MAEPDLVWSEPEEREGLQPISMVSFDYDGDDFSDINEGNRFLFRSFQFHVTQQFENETHFYDFFQSRQFPKARLLASKPKNREIGHMVAIIEIGGIMQIMEYYDSTGRTSMHLPDEVKDIITHGNRFFLQDSVTHQHQVSDLLCARYALFRATYSNLNNDRYSKMLMDKQAEYDLPSAASVVWNTTQNTLFDIGGEVAERFVIYS